MFRLSCLACLVLTLFFATIPARADGLQDAIAGLGGASFADKEKAVVALGKSGDPRAVPILQALGGARLRKAPAGRAVIVEAAGNSAGVTDAATGQTQPDLASGRPDHIIVNNPLR